MLASSAFFGVRKCWLFRDGFHSYMPRSGSTIPSNLQTSGVSTCRTLCWIDRQFMKAVHQENWAMRRLCQTCLTWRLLTQGPRRSRMRMQLRLAEPSCRTTFRSSDSRVGGLAWRWSSNVVTRLCSKDNESEMDNLDQIQRWATLHIYSVRHKSMFRFCLA